MGWSLAACCLRCSFAGFCSSTWLPPPTATAAAAVVAAAAAAAGVAGGGHDDHNDDHDDDADHEEDDEEGSDDPDYTVDDDDDLEAGGAGNCTRYESPFTPAAARRVRYELPAFRGFFLQPFVAGGSHLLPGPFDVVGDTQFERLAGRVHGEAAPVL